MTDREVLVAVLQAFPGARLMPHLHSNPDGLAACTGCGSSTVMLGEDGLPWHETCKRKKMGIEPT